jgi:Protein of unknown function (DUF2934)
MQSKSAPKKKTSKAVVGAEPVEAITAPAPKKARAAKSSKSESSALTAANIETPDTAPKRVAKTTAIENPAISEAPATVSRRKPSVSDEEIRQLAYQFWVERGHTHGSHHDDWVRAEQTLAASAGATQAGL